VEGRNNLRGGAVFLVELPVQGPRPEPGT
jgi:hypothetical protein